MNSPTQASGQMLPLSTWGGVIGLAVVIVALLVAWLSVYRIDAGHVGIVKRFGNVIDVGGATVVLTTTLGRLGPVSYVGSGRYQAVASGIAGRRRGPSDVGHTAASQRGPCGCVKPSSTR